MNAFRKWWGVRWICHGCGREFLTGFWGKRHQDACWKQERAE